MIKVILVLFMIATLVSCGSNNLLHLKNDELDKTDGGLPVV